MGKSIKKISVLVGLASFFVMGMAIQPASAQVVFKDKNFEASFPTTIDCGDFLAEGITLLTGRLFVMADGSVALPGVRAETVFVNLETGKEIYDRVTSRVVFPADPNVSEEFYGLHFQIRDADGKLITNVAGQFTVDGNGEVISSTPNVGLPDEINDVICSALE